MVIYYDYINDLMTLEGVSYPLSPFRKWLLFNHEQLCTAHFIRSIKVGKKTKFTYDWQHIFFIANEYNFTKQYIHELQNSTRETPTTNTIPMEGTKPE